MGFVPDEELSAVEDAPLALPSADMSPPGGGGGGICIFMPEPSVLVALPSAEEVPEGGVIEIPIWLSESMTLCMNPPPPPCPCSC